MFDYQVACVGAREEDTTKDLCEHPIVYSAPHSHELLAASLGLIVRDWLLPRCQVLNEKEETTRKGMCSHYLAAQKPGELVRVAVRPSNFRAPADLTSSPVIMVSQC